MSADRLRPNSKVAVAVRLIEDHFPRDQGDDWSEVLPGLLAAAAAAEIPEHTMRRARQRLGIEWRQVPRFPANGVEWRWPTANESAAEVLALSPPPCRCERALPDEDGACGKCGRSVRAVRAVHAEGRS